MLAACAVGPDFTKPGTPPAAEEAQAYTPATLPPLTASAPVTGGAAQRLVPGQDIPEQWWSLFRSESLDRLIRAALDNSPSLVAAEAALRQAQENFNAEAGTVYYPSVDGQLGAQRERFGSAGLATTGGAGGTAPGTTPGTTPGTPGTTPGATTAAAAPSSTVFNLYNASVNVSYTLDVFGGNRRALEALAALVDYQQFQLRAAYLTLVSNVVTTAIREASLRAQLQRSNEVLALQERQIAVVDAQFQAGAVPRSVVLTQQTQAAQTRATLPPLMKSLAQTQHLLSVLVGRLPSEAGMPEFKLASLQLPTELPISLPSTLVRRRPDILASEALLHQASAQIGVATANLYPLVNLTANVGWNALTIGNLFNSANMVWSLGAGLTQPIFNGGALNARKRAAVAAYQAAAAQYRSTVLTAFQDVADALRAIELDATALQVQADAAALARQNLDLSTLQYRLGAISFLALLDVQRSYQQTQIALVQAEALRFADTAALFQALGGGWLGAEPLTGDAVMLPGSTSAAQATRAVPMPAGATRP